MNFVRCSKDGLFVPAPDYDHTVSILVGVPGSNTEPEQLRAGPFIIRDRGGATLKSVENDVEYWADCFRGSMMNRVLISPTADELTSAVDDALDVFRAVSGAPGWKGGSLAFVFSGHGDENGHLGLLDGFWSINSMLDRIAGEPVGEIRLVLDSCYSGRTLVDAACHPGHGESFVIRDGLTASMQDELSYEEERFKHGLLTYALKYAPSPAELAEAVALEDENFFVEKEPWRQQSAVEILSNGKQHSLDLANGHFLSIAGRGGVELAKAARPHDAESIFRALELLRATKTDETIVL